MQIRKVTNAEDILKCAEVILELRPHLKGKDLVSLYAEMVKETFSIIYVEEGNKAVAFAGYRHLTMFFSGATLYIDDLCTLPSHRGKGYANLLLDHIIKEARENSVDVVSLDSGHHRYNAHKLYLNKDFVIEGHHFHLDLKKNL